MEERKVEPITEGNLSETLEYFSVLKGRIKGAMWSRNVAAVVGILMLLLMAFCLLLVIFALSEPEAWSKMAADIPPLLRAVTELGVDIVHRSPEKWYVRLIIFLLMFYGIPSIVYQVIQAALSPLLRKSCGRIKLPKEEIPRAKKLYRTAKKMVDKNMLEGSLTMTGAITTGVLVAALIPALEIISMISEGSTPDWGQMIIVTAGLGIFTCFLVGLFLVFNSLINPVKDKDVSALNTLQYRLHDYWMSVDPEEAKRENLRRWRGRSTPWWVGMNLNGSTSYPGLTNSDHDALDAALGPHDYHTGV